MAPRDRRKGLLRHRSPEDRQARAAFEDDPLAIGAFQPPLGKRAIYRELKGLRNAVAANRVVLEAGAASGREPTASIELRSHLSQFLQERGLSVGAEDAIPIPTR
jgi:hypothetical protein